MTDLWHYTCDHSYAVIGSVGVLKTPRQLGVDVDGLPRELRWLADLVWLTDLDTPDVGGLGLTAETITCDRTAHRYRVMATPAYRWVRWARRHLPPDVRRAFEEAEPRAMPAHWWVAEGGAAVLLEERAA